MSERLCKDCRHMRMGVTFMHCRHPSRTVGCERTTFAAIERNYGACGDSGKHFEQRISLWQRLRLWWTA